MPWTKNFLNKEATMNRTFLSNEYCKTPMECRDPLLIKIETDTKNSMRFCEDSEKKYPTFFFIFTTSVTGGIPITGGVCERQQAATQSTDIADLLTQFQSTTTRTEQKALLDSLITAWTNISGMARSLKAQAADKYRMQYQTCTNDQVWKAAA
jgi:hypothetical protein